MHHPFPSSIIGVHGGVLVAMEGGDPYVCECEFDEMPTRRWESGAGGVTLVTVAGLQIYRFGRVATWKTWVGGRQLACVVFSCWDGELAKPNVHAFQDSTCKRNLFGHV